MCEAAEVVHYHSSCVSDAHAELREAHFKTNVNKQISTLTKPEDDDQKYQHFLDFVKNVEEGTEFRFLT